LVSIRIALGREGGGPGSGFGGAVSAMAVQAVGIVVGSAPVRIPTGPAPSRRKPRPREPPPDRSTLGR
jgi:hypothetical protein